MTNIWDGLKAGLDLLDSRTDTIVGGLPGRSRNASVFLLTDGVPNIEPPRGYIPTMQRYKDQHGGKYPGIVNTFGFGYSLKSDCCPPMHPRALAPMLSYRTLAL